MPTNAAAVSRPEARAAEAGATTAPSVDRDPLKTPRFNSTEVLRVADAELLKAAGMAPAPGEAPLDTARRHLGEPLPELIEPD
jgi:hypothetical protein